MILLRMKRDQLSAVCHIFLSGEVGLHAAHTGNWDIGG
ncbi:hypothetical protein FHU29_002795 [Hoyosella altamirensis]|uniref:Uncharacterized protein n=2 Tax=Hoyosella TaxID=697025 RepID=F6EM14_HOYSD|nr:hypothetical protein AS9A_4362 [Hoyosella subflava DQS3-9A1]MBB3038346.1 hypothetical protein [Hoyosella altamirensis]